ncbi:hypothetical protein DUE52_00725 [Larkinella punicea]|uniref:Uncharacterized protein n=2 Tax=Larkinella punicea TaxID=2315727 RepID=A0A368JUZ5_9BACT|nr:hypothetical protein DUE52_00725 [Larkinella punicea]
MYLCVKRFATIQHSNENLKIHFREFFDRYLTVRNAPADKPYIIPFESSSTRIWLNNNLAGSFAPSSIRPDNPVNTVIGVNGVGSKATYSLKEKHWQTAKKNLLNGKKIPVFALASFLYRDFGFLAVDMNPPKLIYIFQSEFGYLEEGGPSKEFEELYDSEINYLTGTVFGEHHDL